MYRNIGLLRALSQRTFLYGFLFLILGFIIPEIPGTKANVYPKNLIVSVYPVDIFNTDFSDFRNFNVKRDFPFSPFAKKHSEENARSPLPSDQCYFYEGHRPIADKGPEPALLALSGIFFGYPIIAISIIYKLPYVLFSSRNGNSTKIRPPPFL